MTESTTAPAEPQPFVIDELVCFALYNASHAITQTYRSVLAPWNLTYPQYLVFVVLWNEGAMSLRDLGARLQLDSGTLSPLTKRMEEAGYLERSRASDDARVVTIGLTDKGERMREQLATVPACVSGAMKLDRSTAEQLRGMLNQLADDTRSFDAASAGPASFDATETPGAPDAGR